MSGMPTASGYPNYSGSLIQPHLTNRIIDRFYCETPFMELTTGDFLGELRRCGDTIQFRRKPRASVHPLIKNQKMEDDYLETDCLAIEASKGLYYSLKIDDIDLHQICNSRELIDFYTDDALRLFKKAMEIDVFSEMVCGVDTANQGKCAGAMTHCYDMGNDTDPVCINCDNILDWLCDAYSVLMESCCVTPGHSYMIDGPMSGGSAEPFIPLPIEGYNVLKRAMGKGNCCLATDGVPLVTGRIPEKIGNFHIYVTPHLPYTKFSGNDRNYMIPFGRRDATAFTTTMEDMREVTNDCFWGRKYQGMVVWAAGVLYPECLGLGRVKFEK